MFRDGSDLRNQAIALVLYEMQFAETMGSGVGRIKHELEVRGLPEARFENARFADEFATVFPLEEAGLSGGSDSQPRGSDGLSEGTDGLSEGTDGLSEGTDGLSEGTDGLSGGSDGLSEGTDGLSGGTDGLREQLPGFLLRRLDELGNRPRPQAVRVLIVELCSVRPLSPGELAELLNRKRNYVLTNYISPLVVEGLLQRLYPVNDPRQKYSAADGGRAGDAEE